MIKEIPCLKWPLESGAPLREDCQPDVSPC